MLLLFNLSVIIAYKVTVIAFEIYEFAINGNLPSQMAYKCRQIVIISIWIFSFCYLVIFTTLETVWSKEGNYNKDQLDRFNYASVCLQTLLFIVVSVSFFFSGRRLVKL